MSDDVYKNLATALATVGLGFPTTDSGLEIKIVKKIFTPEEADIYSILTHNAESMKEIAVRSGKPIEELEKMLPAMVEKEQIKTYEIDGQHYFKYSYWVTDLFDVQSARLDQEFTKMIEAYRPFLKKAPSHWLSIPVEEVIQSGQEAYPYERASTILDENEAFYLIPCFCRVDQERLGHPCRQSEKEVCMVVAPDKEKFSDMGFGREITKDEARAHLQKCEELGLVKLVHNYQDGRFFICNCCSCCCSILKGISILNLPAAEAINSGYFARINSDKCTACGICADERCPVQAIELIDGDYTVLLERCIGCGVCGPTCPENAIQLHRKSDEETAEPFKDFVAMSIERGDHRFADHKSSDLGSSDQRS